MDMFYYYGLFQGYGDGVVMSILLLVRYDVLYRVVLKFVWFIFIRRYYIYLMRYDGEFEVVFEILLNVV